METEGSKEDISWLRNVRKWADTRKAEGPAISPPLASNQNLSSNKGSQYDQILASCEDLDKLWADKIIGDLCGKTWTAALLGDGPGQSDARNSYFRRAKSAQFFLLFSLPINEGAGTHGDLRTDGVARYFKDDDLGVVRTRGGQGVSNRHLAGPPHACFEARLGVLR